MAVNRLIRLPFPPKCGGREWADCAAEIEDYLRKVAAMAEDVQRQVVKLAEPPPTSIPVILRQYAYAYISAAQTARITSGNHIEFDRFSLLGAFPAGNVAMSTGSGQANGVFTLTGRRYLVVLQVLGQTNEGFITGAWADAAGATIDNEGGLRDVGFRLLDPAVSDTCPIQQGFAIYDARFAPITMTLRFFNVSNATSIDQPTAVYFFPLG